MVCYSDEMEDLEAAEKLYGVWGNEEYGVHRPKIRRTRRGEDQRQTRDLVPRLRESEYILTYQIRAVLIIVQRGSYI